MSNETIIALISAVVGGGFLSGLAGLWKARLDSKRVHVDLNSVTISSAEHVLLMLKTALEEAEKDIIELKRERDFERERHRKESEEKDRRIVELENNLKHISTLFQEVSDQLTRVLQTAKDATQP